MANVKIPGIGEIPKPLAVGGIAVGLGGAYWIYKRQKASAASASAATASSAAPVAAGDPFPPDGSTGNAADPNSTDPTTGLTYGDEELQGTETGFAGSGALQDVGSSPALPGAVTGTDTTVAPSTPQQWASDVEALLPNLGYDPMAVAAALGRYIAGLTLSADQAAIIQAGLAEVPYPGTAPAVRVTPAAPPPTGGTLPAPGGLSDTPYGNFADLGWHGVAGATNYHWQVLSGAGAILQDSVTTGGSARASGLRPRTAYKWRVQADPNGLWSPEKTFTTKAS